LGAHLIPVCFLPPPHARSEEADAEDVLGGGLRSSEEGSRGGAVTVRADGRGGNEGVVTMSWRCGDVLKFDCSSSIFGCFSHDAIRGSIAGGTVWVDKILRHILGIKHDL